MATVVTITDRPSWDANTDNIIVVDPAARALLWIPRDLWCPRLGDRVNRAFAMGGAAALTGALAEHGVVARQSLCLRRDAVESALENIAVTVPVGRPMAYWYPLEPLRRLQDGRKRVTFAPPFETLTGERVHQWLGARRRAELPGLRGLLHRLGRRLSFRSRTPFLPDLDRIERHKVFLRALIAGGFDFARALENPERFRATGDEVWDELGEVRADWTCATLSGLVPRTVDGRQVLVRAASGDEPDARA